MIPETFLGVGYTRDRAGLPLEAVRVPVPQPAVDEVLIRVAASSIKLPILNSRLKSLPPALSSRRADTRAARDDPFCNWIALIKPPFLDAGESTFEGWGNAVDTNAEGPAYGRG
jgi:hypothetical protein